MSLGPRKHQNHCKNYCCMQENNHGSVTEFRKLFFFPPDVSICIFNEKINCILIEQRIWNLYMLGILYQLFGGCAAKEFLLGWALSQSAAYE